MGVLLLLLLFWCRFFFLMLLHLSCFTCVWFFHLVYIGGFVKPVEGFFNTQILTATVSIEIKF